MRRYKQFDRARKLRRKKTIPHYSIKHRAWRYYDDDYIHYDIYLERLLQKNVKECVLYSFALGQTVPIEMK